jgi:preprotein translocase subunit Sss1
MGKLINLNVLDLEEFFRPFRSLVGIALLVLSGWVLIVVMDYPELYLLHMVWVIAFIFGILYLFFPKLLDEISRIADMHIFPTDKYVLGSSKVMGLVLIIVGVIIFTISLIY